MKAFGLALVAIIVGGLRFAPGSPPMFANAAWTAGAVADEKKVLHLYSSLDSLELPVYFKEFEQKTGVEVKFVRLSAGETLARIEAEKGNPQVSVWFGGSAPEFIAAKQKGLLESYKPKIDFVLDAKDHDPDWAWTGFYFGAIGFACNEKYFAEKKTKCPDTWQGLLDPALKGQISMAFPYTSGTAFTVVSTLLQMYGPDKGWEYIKKLDGQIHHYNKSGSAAVTQVGLGEVAVGISFSHDVLWKGRGSGYPVALSVPKDGTATEIGAMAMIKGAKEPELAKLFIDHMLSVDGQNELEKFKRVGFNPKAKRPEGAITQSMVKIVDYDAIKAASQQKEILAQWRKVTAR